MAAKTKDKPEPKRRRTGENKRKAAKQQGKPILPDERKVRTGADAALFWEGSGAWELTQGMTMRASVAEDLEAFANVKSVIDAEPKAFGERLLTAALVTGAASVVSTLEKIEEAGVPADEG